MQTVISHLQALCWNPLMLSAFMGTGLYFTISSGFFQLRKIPFIIRETFGSIKEHGGDGITPFAALSAALAACMGTGNIIGVACALTLGGPGAVLWMILSAFLGEMTCCAENILAIEYRTKNSKNEWHGGSMCYIENAFSSRKIACIFSVFCVGASLGMGNMTQANAISTAISELTETVPFAVGAAIAALAGMVIFGGVKRISSVTEKIIPLASLAVIAVLLAVIIKNRTNILPSIKLIFSCAFDSSSVSGGFAGCTVSKAVKYGIARGVFSNEAGLGSSPLVHSSADVREPLTQGLWGIVEVFIDTVLMCTLTALALLTGGAYTPFSAASPTRMSVLAFESVLGKGAGLFTCISLCVFAFATIIGWGFYGEKAAEYAFGEKSVTPFRIVFLCCTVIGAVITLDTVWALSDIFNALMAIPNLAALFRLRKTAVRSINRTKNSKKPVHSF